MEELNTMRLSVIKLKMNVQNLEKEIKSREKIDEDLHTLGFEQLQSENNVLQNKLLYRQNEIERYKNRYDDNKSDISSLKDELEIIQESLSDQRTSVKTLDNQISEAGRELSNLVNHYNEIQKDFKVQSNVASNKIVHDHYVSSIEKVKQLTSKLENLKKRYLEISDKRSLNRFSL
jgi:chromosome segregation ATPase